VIGEHNAAWEAWFASAGVWPLRVTYEELDADMAGVTLGILDFLGLDVPGEHVIMPRHERQADELSARWIERYRLDPGGSPPRTAGNDTHRSVSGLSL
jgi:LPS sulfotransferase NodH